jgi:rubrerythrin
MIMNVLDVAAAKEKQVKSYYEKLAAETALAGIRNIFTLLAGDEQKHYEMVLALQSGRLPDLSPDSTILEYARETVGKMIGDKDAALSIRNDLEGYRHALEVEAESVRFYDRIAAEESDESSRKVLQKILCEEKKHYNVVENLYDFAQKPEYFLAWGEFGNLRDL